MTNAVRAIVLVVVVSTLVGCSSEPDVDVPSPAIEMGLTPSVLPDKCLDSTPFLCMYVFALGMCAYTCSGAPVCPPEPPPETALQRCETPRERVID